MVGKPNVGKSTFFSAATMANAEIANYPFTTIEANKGVGYVRSPCPCTEFEKQCNPNNADCINGTRHVPVEIIDVAGLVKDAHQGKGLGNKFLDDLSRASVLIHIIDASGSTDAEGQPCEIGSHDPVEDVQFLEDEISFWIKDILERDWRRLSRQVKAEGKKLSVLLHDKLTGLGLSESDIHSALREAALEGDPYKWDDEQMLTLCRCIRRIGKPIIIAANKCDKAPKENIERLKALEGFKVIPTTADYELALRKASKAGLVEYEIGSGKFEILKKDALNQQQLKALEHIQEILDEYGSTGVQLCLEEAIYNILDQIVVYPVEDETHFTDKQERVLPDAYLMKRGSTAHDLAFKVHTDLGENFIRAIDARTHRVIGHDHELKDKDIIKIVAKA